MVEPEHNLQGLITYIKGQYQPRLTLTDGQELATERQELAEADQKMAEATQKLAEADKKLAEATTKNIEADQKLTELAEANTGLAANQPTTNVPNSPPTIEELPDLYKKIKIPQSTIFTKQFNDFITELTTTLNKDQINILKISYAVLNDSFLTMPGNVPGGQAESDA